MLWWKALFLAPIWLYAVLPFVGSIVSFMGPTPMAITYLAALIFSLFYFVGDILKRKFRIEKGLIYHGFRVCDLTKLLSVGTEYKSNDVLPRKMIMTFDQGFTMVFNVNRINAADFQRLLKHIENHYPQCQIDPVLNSLLGCKKIARKVLVDDGNKFMIEYKANQLWRNMRQSFIDTAIPWLRFGPLFLGFMMSSQWISWIHSWLYMPVYDRNLNNGTAATLSSELHNITKPVMDVIEATCKTAVGATSHPIVAAISFSLLAYVTIYLLRVLTRPNSLNIDNNGLNLALSAAGFSMSRRQIKWDQVNSAALEISARGTAKIKFQMKEGKPFFLDLAAVQVNDRPRLARALERFAPGCTIESELSEAMMPNREHSYTELWLQSLSAAPERNSMQALTPGQRLNNDRYKVLKRLGVGGQGTAYLCWDEIDRCNIVLKETIVPAYADRSLREQALKGFEKEAKILESLDCDGIVRLKDYFFEDHRGYIGLEHIDGQNLRQLVEESGPLSEERSLDLARQMCNILAYLHERSIIHRDFTPDNLILTGDNVLKLIDFNVAQIQQVGTTGTIAGKHSYLPPEQFRGKATCQSDIYAMGATLHFLVTGKDPEAISQSSPQEAGVAVSEGFDKIVRTCTVLDLTKRFADVASVSADLTGKAHIGKEKENKDNGAEENNTDSHTIKITLTEKEKMQA